MLYNHDDIEASTLIEMQYKCGGRRGNQSLTMLILDSIIDSVLLSRRRNLLAHKNTHFGAVIWMEFDGSIIRHDRFDLIGPYIGASPHFLCHFGLGQE